MECQVHVRKKRLADAIEQSPKAFYSNSHFKLKTKETVGSIPDADGMLYDDAGAASIINDYFRSVFTDDKIHIPQPVQISNRSLNGISSRKDYVFKLLRNIQCFFEKV